MGPYEPEPHALAGMAQAVLEGKRGREIAAREAHCGGFAGVSDELRLAVRILVEALVSIAVALLAIAIFAEVVAHPSGAF